MTRPIPDFTTLTMPELKALHEAYSAVAAVLTGYQNQPRCTLRGAVGIIEDECEWAYEMAKRVVREAAGRRAVTQADRHLQTRIIVTDAVDAEEWGDALAALAGVVRPGGPESAGVPISGAA